MKRCSRFQPKYMYEISTEPCVVYPRGVLIISTQSAIYNLSHADSPSFSPAPECCKTPSPQHTWHSPCWWCLPGPTWPPGGAATGSSGLHLHLHPQLDLPQNQLDHLHFHPPRPRRRRSHSL